ncbi:hypothetical protein [Pelagicoccus sp. SDUM812002]|uniref:hypothetical protein n=1 Tax=Pelagicoccus sp. SDUM812002 TaxID=3041266 RepID=UPI00280F92AA|nr:hypothetical protein [Pelagicoccus sp. SDUM812002]MDQ8187691.1 hypothetical protein [Pelagicoccus sp. SDUM812002]
MLQSANLLDTADLDPPMGDLFSFRTLSECRSVWTAPKTGESDAPAQRIIHCRAFTPTGRATVERIGFRNAPGYHKCGSHQEDDWIVDLRILTLDTPHSEWRELHYLRDLPQQANKAFKWVDLGELKTYGLILEIRRCGIDDWWTPWNLAAQAFVVEGKLHDPIAPRNEALIETSNIDLSALPEGLQAIQSNGQIRYKSDTLEIGFYLSRTGFSYLGIDQTGKSKTDTNLLQVGPGSFHQGAMLSPLGDIPVADPAVRFRFTGTVSVEANTIVYQLHNERCGQSYRLEWTVLPEKLHLKIKRESQRPQRAWHSAAWRMSFHAPAAASQIIALVDTCGQTGSFESPAILHAPANGSLAICAAGKAKARLEVLRPRDRIELELKAGEVPCEEGDWLLEPGTHEASWTFEVTRPAFALSPEAPKAARAAIVQAGFTGLNFRPDTATLSNNGASMHCPISMDTWACQCLSMGELLPGLRSEDLLRLSLERWLTGGPGYAGGNLKQEGSLHSGEDEYLMTGTATLLGLAEYLHKAATPAWIERFSKEIEQKIREMQVRDLDGDGLIESPFRTGTSGSRQWSTCWYDVISYGWKDAFSNALLYEALNHLAQALPGSVLAHWCEPVETWKTQIHASYFNTFFNLETGWLAGWVCKEGKLHDHAFLAANGAAIAAGLIELDTAKSILQNLLAEAKAVGMPTARLGLPGNLRSIPDEDLSDIIQGYPFGYYQNGGRTHAQARHFLRGLYAVGLRQKADVLLQELSQGLAAAEVFGGCKSGLDWRYWDDRPCGYEGLLTDQFGVIGLILERYGLPTETSQP